MASIFGQIDPASFVLTTIGIIWAVEQGLGGIVKESLKNYNIKILRTIQASYDRTDLLRPLLRSNHDLSDFSVSLLCDKLVSTFKISSLPLWLGVKFCVIAQKSTFALFKIICLLLANFFYFLHCVIWRHQRPKGAWVYDLEWNELTVRMAIEELKTLLVGDNLLKILYQISQSKSGPLACKLSSDKPYNDNKVSIAELLITAFAIYNVDGQQVIEKQDIPVLGLATVMFESAQSEDQPSRIIVNIYIDEMVLQFPIDARCEKKNIEDLAHLVQYAIATNNRWLYRICGSGYDYISGYDDDDAVAQEFINMAIAAGSAIATNCRGSTLVKPKARYSNWINNNFGFRKQLPWCQHHDFVRSHCELTQFLIIDPDNGIILEFYKGKRNVITVSINENHAVRKLESHIDTALAFVRLSSQSQIITNSEQFKRTHRIIIAGTEETRKKFAEPIPVEQTV